MRAFMLKRTENLVLIDILGLLHECESLAPRFDFDFTNWYQPLDHLDS